MSNKISKTELDEVQNRKVASKQYSNGEVTVYWKRELCIHSANCLIGLPEVFNMGKRPWINIQGASTRDIIRVVDTCPTRALTWLKENDMKPAAPRKKSKKPLKYTRIQVMNSGPVLIKGNFIIRDENNKRIPAESDIIALCRCGGSRKKPFCDGTHKKIGFQD